MPPSATSAAAALGPEPAGILQLQDLFQRVLNISTGIAFVLVIVMLTWAGVRYITSGGESKSLSSASGTITWALLGLLFMILGWLIIKLIEVFTGVNVTFFCLGFPGAPTKCP